MYGKFFASAFTGSMMASGAEVFAVWGYVIAHAVKSHVELNPKLLAAVIGSTPERMQVAIDTLCSPDPDSRSKELDGRRLVKEGEYLYLVTNHEKYRSIRNEDDRREYNRIKKQEERARKSNGVKQPVNDCQSSQPIQKQYTEADTYTKDKNMSVAQALHPTTLPLMKGEELQIPESLVSEWVQTYPQVDVPATIKEMRAWCLSNPSRKKTKRGALRFINQWLRTAQEEYAQR